MYQSPPKQFPVSLKLIKQVHRSWNTISYSLQYISIKQKHNNDIYNNDNINVTYAFDTI